VQAHSQKFRSSKNPGKIPENLQKSVKTFPKPLKVWANSLKIRAKMEPNVL